MNALITTKQDKENLNFLLQFKKKCPKSWAPAISKSNEKHYLLNWLNLKTPLLQNGNYNTITKLYWVVNGLTDFPNCMFCIDGKCPIGKDVKCIRNVDSFDKGYFRACCTKCPNMQKAKQEKYVQTSIKNFGSTNFFSSNIGKKAKSDWCEANGITNAFQLESVKKKSCQTRKEHFGYEYTMQSPDKRKLASNNYKDKTGYEHQFKDPNVISKSNDTKQHKKADGIDICANRRIGNRRRRYNEFLKNTHIQPLFTEEYFIALDDKTQYTTLLKWHCLDCNTDFEAYIDANFSSREGIPVRCLKCHPLTTTCGISKEEVEIANFIESLNIDIIRGDRQTIAPLELDILAEDKKLAIEYDGLFWHSERNGNKPKLYHLMKTEKCEKNGIQLIHIFEDEWLNKKCIVKSRLKNLLGIYDNVVYARSCQIKEISSNESRKFQEDNHIQGAVNSKVSLGLYYDDELISLMTFGKCRFDKKHEWELLRFCNKLGYHIPGAAGKMLKHFERNYKPKSLVSYADRRWSQGKLYKALGFNFVQESTPNYFYLSKTFSVRLSRQQFQKHKLKDILAVFDPNKTELANMNDNGYDRIFDCGTLVYEKLY